MTLVRESKARAEAGQCRSLRRSTSGHKENWPEGSGLKAKCAPVMSRGEPFAGAWWCIRSKGMEVVSVWPLRTVHGHKDSSKAAGGRVSKREYLFQAGRGEKTNHWPRRQAIEHERGFGTNQAVQRPVQKPATAAFCSIRNFGKYSQMRGSRLLCGGVDKEATTRARGRVVGCEGLGKLNCRVIRGERAKERRAGERKKIGRVWCDRSSGRKCRPMINRQVNPTDLSEHHPQAGGSRRCYR